MANEIIGTLPRWFANNPAIFATESLWFMDTGGWVLANRPTWTLTGVGALATPSLNRPAWTLSGVGAFGGWSSSIIGTESPWTLTAAGSGNNPWQLDVTRPTWSLTSLGGNSSSLIRPSWSLTGAGVPGYLASVVASRALWTLAGAGAQSGIGSITSTESRWTLSALGYTTSPGLIVARRASISLAAAGILSNLGTLVTSERPWTLTGAGYTPAPLTGSLTRAAWQLFGYGPGTDSSNFRTWAVNLPKRAVTEYTGLSPVGFAQIGQSYYMATGAGLFRLGIGDTDNGVAIASQVDLGKNDLNSHFHSRLPRVYVSGKFLGAMEVHTVLAESGRRKYLLVDNLTTGFVQRRVPMGRGPRSRYWQIGFANRGGADFTLASILAVPTRDSRRIS